jgi:hypothetical protein
MAGINWGGNVLKEIIGGGPGTGPGGGLDLTAGGGGTAHGLLGGAAPGPSTVINNNSTINGPVGVNRPMEHQQMVNNQSMRRQPAVTRR